MSLLSTHLRRHRGQLAVTYVAVVLENTFELLYPFAIGLAVDDLLDDEWRGVIVFALIWLAHTVLSVARQRYDTRSFNRLYTDMATDLVEEHRDLGIPTSTVVARAALAGEYVDFLERDVDVSITAGFAVVGSLVMIFFYDPILGLAAAAVAAPVAMLNLRLVRRSRHVYRRLNDVLEVEVTVIEQGSVDDVHRHFGTLASHWIRLSDAEASTWGVFQLIAAGLAVFALVSTTSTEAQAGAIFATIAYVWSYIGGFDQIPTVLQRIANLRDIRRRLDGADMAED
ncbi:MAG: hypothetical protein IPM45_03840 [Acidimicrobiales bacterium]|nr:hypothetical protein [Acidimicrobiales bacterium]